MARHPYAELHCHSCFSFLDGVSQPADLVAEAVRLELDGLALTDHNGLYGAISFAGAARDAGLAAVVGAELTLPAADSRPSRTGQPDPPGEHLVILARGPDGYARLSRAIAEAHLAGREKGRPIFSLADLADRHGGQWQVLTGCRKGPVVRALYQQGPSAASRTLATLIDAFGHDNLAVEIWDHSDPLDSVRNDALVELAVQAGLRVVATNNVHYATAKSWPLASSVAAVRARSDLASHEGWLPAWPAASLRSGAEQAERLSRYPGVTEMAAIIASECALDLSLVAPGLPNFAAPEGQSEIAYLTELAMRGATDRYGPRAQERVRGAWRQIDHELAIIEQLGFAGYFLTVWDIVQFCRRNNIYCQGRGSAANSAVCYSIGITNVDAVSLGLLFERFLSPARDGPPDIDLDIESARRDEVIAYVFERHSRHHAAQVANVITYRARSALRDAASALGYPISQINAWTAQIEGHRVLPQTATGRRPAIRQTDPVIPDTVVELAQQMEGLPRHLGLHSGGMVICDRPVVEVCPVEWARVSGRTVLQWDKESCAEAGLVKFDLLGLGMLSALHEMVDLVERHYGIKIDLARLEQDDEVYDMLCRADTVGVFQVESRAQMATLPRLQPRRFYDLVVEVALIRPGPIQGDSVHPYIRRRNGLEPVTYLHPLLERSLAKTLGVPLFQEQLMQMAMDVANFSAADADRLRQAMGSKRSAERMEELRERFYAGMAANQITGEVADQIFAKMAAFANFGFPESHSASFAYLVYASAWFKLHYPAAFYAALLNCQPMGFWSPATLVADARRHQVKVRRADVNHSRAKCHLEPNPDTPSELGLRLSLNSVRSVSTSTAEQIALGQPYVDLEDLARRAALTKEQLSALAEAGALGSLSHPQESAATGRRRDMWRAGAVGLYRDHSAPRLASAVRPDPLPGLGSDLSPPDLAPMTLAEEVAADMSTTGVPLAANPIELARAFLDGLGATTAGQLANLSTGQKVVIGGLVTHRQRPATAKGTVFVNLEDETGLVNVICPAGIWKRFAHVARSAAALVVTGRLESNQGAVAVVAHKIVRLDLNLATTAWRSRDFQ